ncbi:MAG TPA: ATP-binding cassette domain-containing protein [Candidatus Bathyarchaeia archaeon]|nr:ATP-binding cassette domain-containing protein [Candidatus Bathyarchaeia archaeon]
MLKAEGLTKQLGTFYLGPMDFEVGNEVVVFLGDNGSGKTTLLNLIAGILKPDRGTISKDNSVINPLPIEKRNIGYVFQNTCLFPHMRVRENITYGLRDSSDVANLQHLNYLVNLLGIRDLLDREVLGLSGGEQQRVAIVRTLATQPDILLMDEPMKNLDFKTRQRLVSELKQLFDLFNKPTIYVTHDPEEAINLGDVFLILDKGRIVSRASPDQLKNQLIHDYGVKPTSFGSSTT